MTTLTRSSSPPPAPVPASDHRGEADVVHLPDGDHYRHLHFDRGARLCVDPFASSAAAEIADLRRSA